MAAKAPLRLATTTTTTLRPRGPVHIPRRTFLNALLPSDKPLGINVTRTLPYPRDKLYDLIVDVDSYSRFLPYCRHSRVTARDPRDQRRPVEGELTVGFGPVTQSYTSRIVCVPGRSVEALSGRDEEALPGARGNPFRKLVTKWTVEDAPGAGSRGEWTKVDLDLSMRMEDPLVQVILSKVVDETAARCIDAFEARARELYGSGR